MNGYSKICVICSITNDYNFQLTPMNKLLLLCFPGLDICTYGNLTLCNSCFEVVNVLYRFTNQFHQAAHQVDACKKDINNESKSGYFSKILYSRLTVKTEKSEKVVDSYSRTKLFINPGNNECFRKTCRTCLLVIDENTYKIDFIHLNTQQKLIRSMLYLCCPNVDLRYIYPHVILCKSCIGALNILSKFTWKCKLIQEKSGKIVYLTENATFYTNNEVKIEKVDLIDSKDPLEINTLTHIINSNNYNEIKECKPKFHGQILHIVLNKHPVTYVEEKPFKVFASDYSCIPKSSTIQHTDNLKCLYCDFSSTDNNFLTQHICKHTGEKPFKCLQCNYSCAYKSKFQRHIYIHSKKKPFKCSRCNYTCTEKSTLKRHMYIHTGEKPFKCENCDYSTIRKLHLKRHIEYHTTAKQFKCPHCDYSSTRNSNLQLHLRIHMIFKPLKCSQCDYSCISNSDLLRHMYHHTGEKPFKCPHCEFKYVYKCQLKRHAYIHTGERPYGCSQCSYTCVYLGNLRKHTLIHAGEKAFKCAQCSYSCVYKSELKQHFYVHTREKPFKCFNCDYSSSRKNDLQRHMHVHIKRKPFKCLQCDFSSTQRGNFKMHILAHSRKQPFKCSQCEYSSEYKSNLKLHIDVHIQ